MIADMKTRRSSSSNREQPTSSSAEVGGESNQAARDALAAQAGRAPDDGFLHDLGEKFGLGAGFVVTELLALIPSWSAPLKDESGASVQSIDGASRIGDHDIEKRHTKVVGPQIAAYAEKLDPGWWKDFVSGVGEGASEAPGASYRIESAVSDHISDTWGR